MQTEEQAEAIRVKAMERFQEEPQELDLERLDARKLVQELRIHQIELEIQNEELRQAQQRVAEVAECYSDLYDFAPVGYLTVDKNTAIRQINLTAAVMLGVGRERLIGKPLSTRVPAAHHTALNTHIRAVLAHKEPAPFEIEIVCPDGRQLWVSIASSLVSARNEPSLCRVTLTDITALKRIERALRESEEKHRLIADNTVDCIWQMNMDLQFVYVNAAVTSLLGYRPNEWVGTRLSDHCPPGELKRMRAAIAAASALDGSGDDIVFEANIFHRDGHLIPFEIMGKVFFGRGREPLGLQGVARDISERRRAEAEIRKFKMLAESASYGVIITDLAGKITYSNAAFACLHGAEVEEMIGSDLSSLQPDRKWSPVHAAESGAHEYEEFGAREMVHRRRDGTEFDVLLNCTLVRDEAGAASFLTVTAMDITELKSLEAQLRQAQKMDLRFTGLDFFADPNRAAVCTWDGSVWLVTGFLGGTELTWRRIACGLFQPLGIKVIDEKLYVACRDQIVRLHDLNGDDEIDHYQCFNSDHQVTEHFHEFAMGLQVDDEGNFYYAKSARHAKTPLVPHHGTLLKVSPDGKHTEIVAVGFRAANGVCVNNDGSFFVTDQEGHWNPKNRINWVRPGRFYGNMWGYHDIDDESDSAMEEPLCWITNHFDRSPGELMWVDSKSWGPLNGALLNLSYGMGQIFVVPHEQLSEAHGGRWQGGMCALPVPLFPTGVMRGRFNPQDGQLYCCGMYAWAGNQQQPGGLYRVRYTGKPVHLPLSMFAKAQTVSIRFTDSLDPHVATDVDRYAVKAWDIRRTANYGSPHIKERELKIAAATLSADGQTVRLLIPELAATRCMEIRYALSASGGEPVIGTIHNTINVLPDE